MNNVSNRRVSGAVCFGKSVRSYNYENGLLVEIRGDGASLDVRQLRTSLSIGKNRAYGFYNDGHLLNIEAMESGGVLSTDAQFMEAGVKSDRSCNS